MGLESKAARPAWIAMSRVLFAFELSCGYGRVAAALALAMPLRALGHEIVFAVRDLTVAERFLAPHGIRAMQAPLWLPENPGSSPPLAYSDVLAQSGYLDATGLEGLVAGWRTLLDDLAPDLLVANHSPTALIASLDRHMRRVLLGDGFSSPPRTIPLPPFQSDLDPGLPARRRTEEKVVKSVNRVLTAIGAPPITDLADLFGVDEDFLCTFRELDHYSGRGAARYWGAAYHDRVGAIPTWPSREHPRIFAYIGPTHPQFETLLRGLTALACPVLVHAPGIAPSIERRHRSAHLTVAPEPVQMGPLVEESDLVVCHAGHGTVARALLGGRPLALVPHSTEQRMTAVNVVRLGAGELLGGNSAASSVKRQLRAVLDEPRYGRHSQAFADLYRAFRQEEQSGGITARCSELLASP
jgi:Glycosyltransferase family 28 C-terminal domain